MRLFVNAVGENEIDLYQPSRIDPNVPIEETVGAIKDLIGEGKVRYLGFQKPMLNS